MRTERGVDMQFDRLKLKALILYACSKCEREALGAVKLHKVLYFSDMLNYAFTGSPITGATYRKRSFGPTCDALLVCLRELEIDGDIIVNDVDYFGFKKKEFIPTKGIDASRLSRKELDLVDDVIDFVCNKNTAKTISELSHNKAWELAEFGDVLPYNSVYQILPTQVTLDTLDWASTEVEKIEAERPNINPMDHKDVSFLRQRIRQARSAQ